MQGDSKERDFMSFDGFCRCIRIDVSHRLKGAEVTVQEVIKNNGIRLHGLVIREKGSSLSPTIYLEQFYRQYQDGMEIGAIENIILDIYRRDKPPVCFDESSFLDWSRAKDSIVFKLVNRDMNRDLLGQVPHVPYLDLAVTFAYCLMGDMPDRSASIAIYNSHLDMWDVTAEDLYDVAKRNTFRLLEPKIQLLGDYLGIQDDASKEFYAGLPQHVLSTGILSNEYKFNGAVGILQERLLRGFADRVGSDLYILPINVHELMLLPTTCGKTEEELNAVVCGFNTRIEEVKVLSDHVYRYIRATGEVTM